MNVFDNCPNCNSAGIKVPSSTVSHHSSSDIDLGSGEWYGCCSSSCDIAYFSGAITLTLEDIGSKIWFKDQGMNVPICYCSNITKQEIHDAVDKGCTNIKEVRNCLDKHITGECELKNPLGGCCHKAFSREIRMNVNRNKGQ